MSPSATFFWHHHEVHAIEQDAGAVELALAAIVQHAGGSRMGDARGGADKDGGEAKLHDDGPRGKPWRMIMRNLCVSVSP